MFPRIGSTEAKQSGLKETIPGVATDLAAVRLLRRQFNDLSNEWRRIIAEAFGTFLLVLAAVGAGAVEAATGGAIGRDAVVVAPALTVAAVILMLGGVSGAHLNPIVTVAFALRHEFPWRRIPAYLGAQLGGGVVACVFIRWVLGSALLHGTTVPMANLGDVRAIAVEAVLSCGLVSTILGTASGAQNVGPLSAFAVAGYVALAGLWASPLTGASMNPVRSLAPDIVGGSFAHLGIYLAGPAIGALVAVFIAFLLRGSGGDLTAARAAQGALGSVILMESTDPAIGTPKTTEQGGSAASSGVSKIPAQAAPR